MLKMLKIIDADTTVQEAIDANDGYCPCAIYQNEDTLCPCREFREQTEPGECRCGRFEKVEVA
jgi:ferredoxin-thioredoxin reductase catalytic subunit